MATPGNSMATPENINNILIFLNCNSGNTGNSKFSSPINNFIAQGYASRAYSFLLLPVLPLLPPSLWNVNIIIILNIYINDIRNFLATAGPCFGNTGNSKPSNLQQSLTL